MKKRHRLIKDAALTIIGLFFAIVIVLAIGALFNAANATVIEADDVIECAKPTYDGCIVGEYFPREVAWEDYVVRETGRIDLAIAGLLYDVERDVVLVYLMETRHVVL